MNATAVHSAVSGPVGYIMTKEDVYRSEEVPSCLEVDFVQGMWSLKKEWLREVIAGTAEEISENNLPSIHVLLSSLLWSRLGIRTLVPAIEAPVVSLTFLNSS